MSKYLMRAMALVFGSKKPQEFSPSDIMRIQRSIMIVNCLTEARCADETACGAFVHYVDFGFSQEEIIELFNDNQSLQRRVAEVRRAVQEYQNMPHTDIEQWLDKLKEQDPSNGLLPESQEIRIAESFVNMKVLVNGGVPPGFEHSHRTQQFDYMRREKVVVDKLRNTHSVLASRFDEAYAAACEHYGFMP